MNRIGTFTTVVASISAATVVGYALYFDYTRRTSAEFRKTLKKKALKQSKIQAKQDKATLDSKLATVKNALEEHLKENPIPTGLEEKEAFFMEQVTLGEQLAVAADKKIDAAICFYKALAVYPKPTDILGIYQKSVPEDVYEMIIMMISSKPPSSIENLLGTNEVDDKVDLD